MPFEFFSADNLRDAEIHLKLERQKPGDDKRGLVPGYEFAICDVNTGRKMGEICLRVGFNEKIFYGGNIGYTVSPKFRGHHYAAKACVLLKELAAKHRLKRLIITCNPENIASRRTCELAGASLRGIVDLPEYNDMYREGERRKCIYEIKL